MGGGQGNTHHAVHQNHHGFLSLASAVLYVFGMAGELELVALDAMFVDGGCNQHVNQSLFVILNGGFKALQCSLSAFLCALSQVYFDFLFDGVHHVEFSFGNLVCRSYGVETGAQFHGLAVIGGYLRAAIDNGGAKFQHGGVFKCFQYHFVAHSVGVAVCDTYFNSFHKMLLPYYIY